MALPPYQLDESTLNLPDFQRHRYENPLPVLLVGLNPSNMEHERIETEGGGIATTVQNFPATQNVNITGQGLANLAVDQRRATAATTSSVNVTTTSTSLLASNANRRHLLITNAGTTPVYLAFGGAATTNGHYLGEGGGLELSNYTGTVFAITSSGSQAITVTEFTV